MLNLDQDGIGSAFRESFTRSLGSADKSKQVLDAYAITDDITRDEAFKSILQFNGFYATHILGVAYLFQNYNEVLPEPQRAVGIQFAHDLIAFSSGRAPRPKFKSETKELYARVYGGRSADTSGQVAIILIPNSRTEPWSCLFGAVLSPMVALVARSFLLIFCSQAKDIVFVWEVIATPTSSLTKVLRLTTFPIAACRSGLNVDG
jgi:hypothetical protein